MRSSYDYAVVRVVPRVERGEFLNAGVILHCPALRYLGARIELDAARLSALAPGVDAAAVEEHLRLIPIVCAGGEGSGPIGRLGQRERWHWLSSSRSTVVQPSPAHSGLCIDPEETLERLVARLVRVPGEDMHHREHREHGEVG